MERHTIHISKHTNKLFTLLEEGPLCQPQQTFDNAGAHFDYGDLCSRLTVIQRERGQTPDTTSSSKVGQRSASREAQNVAEIILPTHMRRKSEATKSIDLLNKGSPYHMKTSSITGNRISLIFDNSKAKKTPISIGCFTKKNANKKQNIFELASTKLSHVTPKININKMQKDFNFKSLDNRKRIEPVPSSNSNAYKKIIDMITPRKILSKMECVRKIKPHNEMSLKKIQ
jgi:hypothetical protein